LTAAILTATTLATLACLSADFAASGSSDTGRLTLAFGLVPVTHDTERVDAVHYLLFVLGVGLADTLGVLVTLIWTAGFLPSFLDPGAVSVLLSKPTGRGTLFAGRVAGVVAYVALQALIFVAATAVAIGVRTGVWASGYWLCAPLLVLHFAVFYSFSALLAAMTRSTAACLVGSLLFWVLCWAMNYGRHALAAWEAGEVTAELVRTAGVGYWLLPKPADFGLILSDALDADRFFPPWVEFQRVREKGLFQPVLSAVSSAAAAAVLLGVAAYEFVHEDY
jgi:hypothetical protein